MPPLGEIDPNVVQRTTPTTATTPHFLKSNKPSRGPKRMRLDDKLYRVPTPVTRIERSYSPHTRNSVLMFLIHHRIYDPAHTKSIGSYRGPTRLEASKMFQIPERTINTWWQNRDKEKFKKVVDRVIFWPRLEKELYARFLEARGLKKPITTGWFRRVSREIFSKHYPSYSGIFTFSNGWYNGFKRRYLIVRRRITKQATRSPERYREIVCSFLRFIRRMTFRPKALPIHGRVMTIIELCLSTREIDPEDTMNMDETPIPFEYTQGYTYERQGEKTVSVKSERSGWDKRQATLILYIFGDGLHRLKPKIIFHGACDGTILADEGHLYSDEVTVEINPSAYNNEKLFIKWIDEEYGPLVKASGKKHLLVMDVVAFHKTPAVKSKLAELGVIPAMIPPGCTSLLQPLDTAINKPFKEMLSRATEKLVADWEKEHPGEKWTVSQRRIMTTYAVAAAARELASRRTLVSKSFIDCGICIKPDGSEDHLIRIKDMPASEIDFTGWEKADPITINEEEIVDSLDDDAYEYGIPGTEDVGDNAVNMRGNYNKMTKQELKDLLREKRLNVGGNKKDLVDRLMIAYETKQKKEDDPPHISHADHVEL